jgi:Tol biopolymer transport system component/signal transduction histidine kinase
MAGQQLSMLKESLTGPETTASVTTTPAAGATEPAATAEPAAPARQAVAAGPVPAVVPADGLAHSPESTGAAPRAPYLRLLRGISRGTPTGERFLLLLFSSIRIAAIAAFGIIVLSGSESLTLTRLIVGFAAVLLVESIALLALCWRQGAVAGRWCIADMSFCAGAMIVGALVTGQAETHAWNRLMSPFVLVTFAGLGMARARPRTIATSTAALAGAFLVTSHTTYHTSYTAAGYFLVLSVVSRAIARNVRMSERALTATRRSALDQARQLARDQERLRHSRILHDRVLQTLDSLVRAGAVQDQQLGAHVAHEAAWLRGLLASGDISSENTADLGTRLQDIAARKTTESLNVEVYAAALTTTTDLPAELVDALAGATEEAVTNVGKHAGTPRAFVRAVRSPTHVTVTVLDHGRGFDQTSTAAGFGMEQSIRARLADVGGDVAILSAPDEGTHVTLRVPIPGPAGELPEPRPSGAPAELPPAPEHRDLDGGRADGSQADEPRSAPDGTGVSWEGSSFRVGRPLATAWHHRRAAAITGAVLVVAVGGPVVARLGMGPGDRGRQVLTPEIPPRVSSGTSREVSTAADTTVTLPRSSPLAPDVVAWSAGPDGDHNNIYTAHVSGDRRVFPLTRTTGPDTLPVISPDRRTIMYMRPDLGALWVMAADGSGQRALFAAGPAGSVRIAMDGRPSWSPDGRYVVVAGVGGQGFGLYVLGVYDGSARRLPTPRAAHMADPAWSPDGTSIAYWASSSPTGGALYTTAADGTGAPVALTHSRPGTDADPAWSPDSRLIAFRRGIADRDRDVWVMGADGRNQRRLTVTPGADQDPSWSPDGHTLAFSSERDGRREIYVTNISGNVTLRLPSAAPWNSGPSWWTGPPKA